MRTVNRTQFIRDKKYGTFKVIVTDFHDKEIQDEIRKTSLKSPEEYIKLMMDGKTCNLWGQLGCCDQLICFASGGIYDGKALDLANKNNELNGPSEFTVEAWEPVVLGNINHLIHIHDVTYKGCKWYHVDHAAKGGYGASDCWGLADCTFEERIFTERNDEECLIPETEKYLGLDASRHIDDYSYDIPILR